MPRPLSTDDDQQPPDDAIPQARPPLPMPANVLDSTIETLNLADKHLRRHANSPTRAEPRAFAGLRGAVTPIQNAELIIEGIGPDALALTRARDTAATS